MPRAGSGAICGAAAAVLALLSLPLLPPLTAARAEVPSVAQEWRVGSPSAGTPQPGAGQPADRAPDHAPDRGRDTAPGEDGAEEAPLPGLRIHPPVGRPRGDGAPRSDEGCPYRGRSLELIV